MLADIFFIKEKRIFGYAPPLKGKRIDDKVSLKSIHANGQILIRQRMPIGRTFLGRISDI